MMAFYEKHLVSLHNPRYAMPQSLEHNWQIAREDCVLFLTDGLFYKSVVYLLFA